MKLTIIIPTLCKSKDILKRTVEKLSNNNSVQRILIFDNTLGEVKTFLSENDKVRIYQSENLYVNAAWNFGVNLAETDYYLLLNDDVICDNKLISECISILDKNENIGLVTVETENIESLEKHLYSNYTTPENEIEYTIHTKDNIRPKLNGWFLMGRKADWSSIPESLKIFFGDNFIYINCINKNKSIAYATNRKIFHVESTTVKELNLIEDGTLNQEEIIFKNLITPKDNRRKVLICTPALTGSVDVRFVDSLVQTVMLCFKNDILIYPIFIANDALLQRARNDLLHTAVKSDADDVIFIDSDQGWNPEDVMRILQHPVDVVSGTIRRKTDNEEYAFKALQSGLVIDENNLIEISGTGTGFLRLTKKAVMSLYNSSPAYMDRGEQKRFVFNVEIGSDGDLISEDIVMSNKLKNLGYKIWLAPEIMINHIGQKIFSGNFLEWCKKKNILIGVK